MSRKAAMFDKQEIAQALSALYECLPRPDLWPGALQRCARSVRADGAAIAADSAHLAFFPSSNLADCLRAYVAEQWFKIDPRWQAEQALGALDTVLSDDMIATPEERASSAFLDGFARRFDLYWWIALPLCAPATRRRLWLTRRHGTAAFALEEVRSLRALALALGQWVRVATLFGEGVGRSLVDALETMGRPAIFLDAHGQAKHLNAAAERMLDADLFVRNGRLLSTSADGNAWIASVVDAGRGRRPALRERVAIVRREKRSLVLEMVALDTPASDVFGRSGAVILLTDLEPRPSSDLTFARRLFKMSPAETRMLTQLAAGHRLDQAARDLNISKETARSQLKSVLAKSGTSRQADLLTMLERLRG